MEFPKNEEKTSLLNLSEILPKRAISWSVRLQNTLKQCAVADLRFLAHLSRRLKGELIVYQSSRRPSVCASVNIFKHEYL